MRFYIGLRRCAFVLFRHAVYQHQYRAMFVMNCVVQADEVLRFPAALLPRSWKRRAKQIKSDDLQNSHEATASSSETVATPSHEEIFHPVTCSECNTEVGVYDCEEVYHFFNVLASHAWHRADLAVTKSFKQFVTFTKRVFFVRDELSLNYVVECVYIDAIHIWCTFWSSVCCSGVSDLCQDIHVVVGWAC